VKAKKVYADRKYKMGYMLCSNNCIRPVEEGSQYCAWCGDDFEYQIPPPKGFKFDKEPPKEHKEAKLGWNPPWVPKKLHEKAKDNHHLLTYQEKREPNKR